MSFRNNLFKHLLKHSLLRYYGLFLAITFVLTLFWFVNAVNQTKQLATSFEHGLAIEIDRVSVKLSHLNVSSRNFTNEPHFRSAIHQLLLNDSDIHQVIVKSGNEIVRYSTDDGGHLAILYANGLYFPMNEELYGGDKFLKIYGKGNFTFVTLVQRFNPESEIFIAAELKLLPAGNIEVNKSSVKWIALNNSASIPELQKVLEKQFNVDVSRMLIRALIVFISISLLFFVLLVLQERLRADAIGNELLLAEDSIVENHDISNISGVFIAILKPFLQRMRLRFHELKVQNLEFSERLSQFYQASVDAIVIHHQGVPIFFNPAFLEMIGYSESVIYSLNLFDIIKMDEDLLREAREGRQPTIEALLRQSSGNTLYVEVQVKPIKFRGQIAESVVIRDTTHRKFMERELQLQRMRQVKSVIDGQEKERQRLSREFHDGLGQNLVAIKLKLESIPPDVAGELNTTLTQVKQMFNHTIEEVRRISNNLMPAALKEFSLAVVLRNLCNEVESNSGISVGLTVGVLPEPIDQLLKTYVYRIIQEGLTNVIKHSGASSVNITVYADFSNLHLIIEDNGVGFNTSIPTETGNGLYNMKERAILLNGSINIISSQGKGTKIVASFPLKPQNQSVNG